MLEAVSVEWLTSFIASEPWPSPIAPLCEEKYDTPIGVDEEARDVACDERWYCSITNEPPM
jgi:hypothetical protein